MMSRFCQNTYTVTEGRISTHECSLTVKDDEYTDMSQVTRSYFALLSDGRRSSTMRMSVV